MEVCRWVTPILAIGITSTVWAQQSTPPPAQSSPVLSAQTTQQLAAEMQIIQKELNSVGKLNFAVAVSNADEKGTSQISEQVSKVIADPATCTIRYHWWESISGNVGDDDDVSISLHDVLGVSTISAEQSWKKEAEKEGATPNELKVYYEKFDPPMFIVEIRMTGDDGEAFSFTDQKQASRVGQAVAQAVSLCGGKPGPF
jgi:hypothetical protein